MHVEFGDLERVEPRDFNGVCVRFAEGARGTEFTSYEALLVPRLWLLGQSADCRCYRDVSVVDIVRSVLGEWGIEQR